MWVEFSGDRLLLVQQSHAEGTRLTFPDRPGADTVPLAFDRVVHESLHPTGTADRVLAAWARGERTGGWRVADEPGEPAPARRRGGAVVVSAGQLLLIRYPSEEGPKYFIPGGGVKAGESPKAAAERELIEETGLAGTAERHLATVFNQGREEHYFLVDVGDTATRARVLDLRAGDALEWVNVAALPGTPMWPRRLAWRIRHWHQNGWPDAPVVLSDSSGDLRSPCIW